jgi:hypothetical protein
MKGTALLILHPSAFILCVALRLKAQGGEGRPNPFPFLTLEGVDDKSGGKECV